MKCYFFVIFAALFALNFIPNSAKVFDSSASRLGVRLSREVFMSAASNMCPLNYVTIGKLCVTCAM